MKILLKNILNCSDRTEKSNTFFCYRDIMGNERKDS